MKKIEEHSVRRFIPGDALLKARFGPECLALAMFRNCLTILFQTMPPAWDIEQGFKDHDLVIEVRAVPRENK